MGAGTRAPRAPASRPGRRGAGVGPSDGRPRRVGCRFSRERTSAADTWGAQYRPHAQQPRRASARAPGQRPTPHPTADQESDRVAGAGGSRGPCDRGFARTGVVLSKGVAIPLRLGHRPHGARVERASKAAIAKLRFGRSKRQRSGLCAAVCATARSACHMPSRTVASTGCCCRVRAGRHRGMRSSSAEPYRGRRSRSSLERSTNSMPGCARSKPRQQSAS